MKARAFGRRCPAERGQGRRRLRWRHRLGGAGGAGGGIGKCRFDLQLVRELVLHLRHVFYIRLSSLCTF
jgi:hypothetical protein